MKAKVRILGRKIAAKFTHFFHSQITEEPQIKLDINQFCHSASQKLQIISVYRPKNYLLIRLQLYLSSNLQSVLLKMNVKMKKFIYLLRNLFKKNTYP